MKPKTSRQRAGESAGATTGRPRHGVVCWALTGFGLGVVSAATYLLLGGEYFFSIPRWAAVAFFPGFLAGFKVNEWGLDKDASKVVGVLAVGLAYAALAALARPAWSALKRRLLTGQTLTDQMNGKR